MIFFKLVTIGEKGQNTLDSTSAQTSEVWSEIQRFGTK